MMKFNLHLFWIIVLFSSHTFGYPSLFQNGSENINVQNHISLDGLIYRSPSDWTLWMNGKKVTPHHKGKIREIVIEKVTPEEVTFSWALTGSKQQEYVTLRPGESIPLLNETKAGEEPYAATSISSLDDELIIPSADK